ncbi:unnamed protein product [Urochloa decumbens]|uniref:KIB1-4 beta-propeller domain-containing protein n=1 Tax=Urochloa decumbens TaxID=240449 RepID=A0ABC8YXW8_9POAL
METTKKPREDTSPLAAASFPLLVYDHGEQLDNSQIALSVADGSSRTYQLPEMRNSRCLETPQGLVLIIDNASFHCSLWNPQTGERTPLPAMEEAPPQYCRCLVSDTGSSTPPWVTDGAAPPESLVLVCDLARPELLFCRIRGGGAWVRQPYDMGRYEIPGFPPTVRTIHEMAVLMGMFFFLHPGEEAVGALVSFAGGDDPEPRHLGFPGFDAPLPTLHRKEEAKKELTATKSYLLESNRELFLVRLMFVVGGTAMERIEEVGAYVMDFAEHRWRRVVGIGDAAFLLGPYGFAASCPAAEHGLKEGCVYFACDDLGDSNDVHVFDLKDGTRELVRPAQDMPVLSRKPFWLVPPVLP